MCVRLSGNFSLIYNVNTPITVQVTYHILYRLKIKSFTISIIQHKAFEFAFLHAIFAFVCIAFRPCTNKVSYKRPLSIVGYNLICQLTKVVTELWKCTTGFRKKNTVSQYCTICPTRSNKLYNSSLADAVVNIPMNIFVALRST